MPETSAHTRHRNELLLVGEVATAPEERELTDGGAIVTFRFDVHSVGEPSGRDRFDCTVRAPRTRRAALAWEPGDVLELSGSVRRRFYRDGGASRPFTIVEVERARRLAPAVSPRRRTRG